MTNMTYAQALAIAIEAIGDTNAEATDKLKALTAQLAKRGTKGGMTKTQKANEALKAIILEILEGTEEFMLMADLMADERLAELSVQKMVYKKRTMYAVDGVEFVAPEAEADAQ